MSTARIITPEQFDKIRPLLENARKKTRPRINDLYDVFCAILYREARGIAWRALPDEFPRWRTVHEYYTMWTLPQPNGGKPLLEQAFAILWPWTEGRADIDQAA
jgi:transposase